jgi:hypothetical protein
MNAIDKLVAAHTALAKSMNLSLKPMELDDDFRERGWVEYPLSESDLKRLEALAGFTFSPLLRLLFSTKGTMPDFEGCGALGLSAWCSQSAFEKNQDIANARKEYDWDSEACRNRTRRGLLCGDRSS